MRWIASAVWAAALMASGYAVSQTAQAKPASAPTVQHITLPASPTALLPDAFDGWVQAAPPQALSDAAQADAAQAAALKEYGFTGGAQATYKREGETLTVRVLRFQDVSGSYGAYSFYRQNGWPKEEIGAGATSDKNRVLIWKGATVVDATFSQIGPMSAGEMRDLAKRLPQAEGNRAILPPILAFLPHNSLEGQTIHYAEGPSGYAGSGGVLPPQLVGFDMGADAVTASYGLSSGPATLTILHYPTPQMAAAQENRIQAYLKAGSQAQPAWPKPLVDSDQASLAVHRSGPLVTIVSGDAIPDESHRLLEMVHFEANLTVIPGESESEVAKTGQLLMGIATLVIIGGGAAILLGFFLGGGRALYRVARGKPVSSVYDEEFIRIDLREPEEASGSLSKEQYPKG